MKDNHLKKIVTGVFIYWILFIAISWITFWIVGSIPDTLVQVGLGGGAFELFCTAGIQVAKKVFECSKPSDSKDDLDVDDITITNQEERDQYYG